MAAKKWTITILSLLLSISTAFSSSVVTAEETVPAEPDPVSENTETAPVEETAEEAAGEISEEDAETEAEEPEQAEEAAGEAADPAEETPAQEAVETEAPAEQEEAEEEPVVSEETEIVEETEVTEEEPAEEVIEEPAEEPVEEETEESDELFNIPEGFKVAASDIEGKKLLIENGVPEALYELTESVDYTAEELIMLAENAEYAEQTAEIYGGEVKSYHNGVAVISLAGSELSVVDAVEASVSNEMLPLVEPNYLVYLEPVNFEEEKEAVPDAYSVQANEPLPEVYDWSGWINDVFYDPDPCLSVPSDYTYQWFHEQIDTYAGWNATMGNDEVLVAVIDEGVNPNHEDLAGRVIVDDVVVTDDTTRLGVGHGTHVAGIIAAAADNGKGGAGVAPNVKILSINIFPEDGGAAVDDIIDAVYKALDYGADVVNMSIGGYMYSYAYDYAIQDAHDQGLIMCVAASNDGTNLKAFPAGFKGTITVASTTKNGTKASYSNFGSWIDVAAPGSDIYSSCSTADEPSNSRYQFMSGTSMATPVVTGAVALYLSKFGTVSPEEMRKILKNCAVKCSSPQMGAGIINLKKMFNGDKAAPEIIVYDKYDNEITSLKTPVEEGSYFEIINTDAGDNDVILYTTNGKKPAVKNGQIVTGEVYDPYTGISLDDFEKNVTIKVNAAVVNSLGVMGKVQTVSIKTPKPADQVLKIKTLALNMTKATTEYGFGEGNIVELKADKLINTANQNVTLDSVDHQWLSSDESIAVVDYDGCVYPIGPGTVKITLKILDGSNKKAVCTITVNQLVEDMDIVGFSNMAPGSSTTYKVNAYPSNAKNKKVVWSLESDTSGVTVTAAGKVTVDKAVPSGTEFEIAAAAQDNGGAVCYKTIKVGEKVTSVLLSASDIMAGYEIPKVIYNTKGLLSNVELFTTPIIDSTHSGQENYIQLNAAIVGGEVDVTWKSSNTKVATVDEEGFVQAVGAGTAKITCTANDASKKSASVSVKVSVPVSSVDIDLGDENYWSVGKTLKLGKKVSYGTAYGKPTNTKMNYWIEEVSYDLDGYTYDKTYDAVTKKLVTVDKSGNLKVNTKITSIADPSRGHLSVIVGISTADGTNYTADAYVNILPAMKALTLDHTGTWLADTDGGYIVYILTDTLANFTVSSSNPNVMGAFVDNYDIYSANFYYKGKYYNGYAIPVYFFTYPGKKGSVKLTVTALDGSNKKTSVSFKVK